MTDKIHIRNLRLRTHIGVADWEKKSRQDLEINLTLEHDQSKAGKSDNVADTLDYREVRDEVVKFVESSKHELLESLAQDLADMILSHEKVLGVTVTIDKPGALRFADSVAIEITRR